VAPSRVGQGRKSLHDDHYISIHLYLSSLIKNSSPESRHTLVTRFVYGMTRHTSRQRDKRRGYE
jgi:hypothetical protein